MGDSIFNALQSQNRSSSVLGEIAKPATVNPLAALGAGTQLAGNILDLRSKQADQAWGQALQQATDPTTGVVDFNKAQGLAAQNPDATMGMARNLQNTSNIRGQQIEQASGLYNLVGRMSASVMSDPSDQNVAAIRAQAVNSGLPSSAIAEIDRIAALPAAQRPAEALNHNLGALDGLTRLQTATGGAPVSLNTGNTIQGGKQSPITGAITPTGGGVPLSMAPGQGGSVEATVQGPQGPVKVQIPYQQAFPGQVTPAANAGTPAGVPPPGTIPVTPAAGVTPGRVTPTNPALLNPNRPQSAPTAASPAPAATATPTPAATPAAPATPPTPSAATPATPGVSSPVIQTPSGPAVVTGLPIGQQGATEETGRQSAQMGSALTARADQVPANKANYGNMLTDLTRIGSMPPGGEKEVAINTFLQKATGYGLTMTPDQVAAANSFAKLANIAVGQQLQAIGGTDARQQLFMGSNPNLDLSKLGNQQIIHMLQGNEDAIQAKSRAWQAWQKGGNGTDTYGQFQNDFNHHFDPRVFQQQYMSAPEITNLRNSLNGPGEVQKFKDDIQYARSQGWIQ